ncbi:MAG: beta-lactamase family protein [Verrucomicrobia bacterium]|nr:beta-lactamase family protein [Verrucomicrobiota bacterium]
MQTIAAPAPASLDSLLEPIRAEKKLPALAAAVVRGGETVAIGAVGFRKDGGTDKVTVLDKWHIGSCTKSMTASLTAMLVEEGKFRWDTTLAEAFPELAAKMKPEWRPVTFEQLLLHTGGAPPNLDADGLWGRLCQRADKPPLEQRAYAVSELLTKHKPIAKPGAKYEYSNAGFMLVGHAIETKLGKPWEEIMRERLFKPLGMDSAGFGPAASVGKVDQPWGHTKKLLGGLKSVPPGVQADNPAAIGPAGIVHCSIGDLAKYVAWHTRGERGGDRLLKAESFKKLHTLVSKEGEYALGWVVLKRGWGGGEVLMHNGSNTMNYTVLWLAPKRDFAVVVCTNFGGAGAAEAADQVVGELIQKFLQQK